MPSILFKKAISGLCVMAAIHLQNDLHRICSTPLEWNYTCSGEADDDPWECFDADFPGEDLKATISREVMAGGGMELFYVSVRSHGKRTCSLFGKEALRLFESLKESYIEARKCGADKYSVGTTSPAAYETTSPLERAITCLKHGVLSFRSAEILEAVYIASAETPMGGDSGWQMSTEIKHSEIDDRKEEVTTFSLTLLGLNVAVSRFIPADDSDIVCMPVVHKESIGNAWGGVPEIMDCALVVTDQSGEEVQMDFGIRAYRIFAKLFGRQKAARALNSDAA